MGLFGRDEKPPQHRTASTAPAAPRPADVAPPSTGKVTIIASPARFKGTVSGPGDIQVDGQLEGKVDASGRVIVSQGGHVEANVHAKVITVSGRVEGDLSADDKIELQPSANVEGNLTAPRILIHEGATFEGQVNMRDPDRPGSKKSSSGSESARRDSRK